MNTRIVRIEGVAFRVPSEELPDPHGDSPAGGCGAYEPDWPDLHGGAVCTLAPHTRTVAHIAHGGEYEVIAIWREESGS